MIGRKDRTEITDIRRKSIERPSVPPKLFIVSPVNARKIIHHQAFNRHIFFRIIIRGGIEKKKKMINCVICLQEKLDLAGVEIAN